MLEQVARENSKACFVMVSSSLHEQSVEVRSAITALADRCCRVWKGIRPHTPREDVLAATVAARNVKADLLVTIGGGSLTDAGKCVCLLLEHAEVRSPSDFDKYRHRGSFMAPPRYAHQGLVRQIAVPTTLSGGEFTHISGVTNSSIPRKEGYVHPLLQPIAVLFDPALVTYTPGWLWTSTGVRAVDHCVEGLCSINANPYSDAQAIAALRLLVSGLRNSAADRRDVKACLDCQIGCMLSASLVRQGIHFGASHALGHALGGVADVPHGYTSCVMLPAVVRYNSEACADKLVFLAELLGSSQCDPAAAIADFIAELGLPRSLRDVEVSSELFPRIAEAAMLDPWMKTNPRRVVGVSGAIEILKMTEASKHARL